MRERERERDGWREKVIKMYELCDYHGNGRLYQCNAMQQRGFERFVITNNNHDSIDTARNLGRSNKI